MSRSITFVVEGDVDTQITITENVDGTLTFDVAVVGDTIGDLRAIFFDLNGGFSAVEGDLYIVDQATTDIAEIQSEEGSIDTLGKDANIKGSVSNELGDFDVGIEFGTSGSSTDDIQTTSFTLASLSGDLSLDMLNFADFGLRYTSVGVEGGERTSSAKIGDTTGGTATSDTIIADENTISSLNLLDNDLAVGTVEAKVVALENASGVFGTLTIAADGTATLDTNGEASDALNDGESASFVVSYTVVNGADSATASITVTINGQTDQILSPLFTQGDDNIDFNTLDLSEFDPSSFYDAGAGNDRIFLPETAEVGELINFDFTQTFFAGDGNDSIIGSEADEIIDLGTGNDSYRDDGGSDIVDGTAGGSTRIDSGDGGNDVFLFGSVGTQSLSYFSATSGVNLNLATGIVTGAAGFDQISGRITNITATNFDDAIVGGDSGTVFYVLGGGSDVFAGGAARDIVIVRNGSLTDQKTLDFGEGTDLLSFNRAPTESITVNLVDGTYQTETIGSGTFTGLEQIETWFGDDTVIGSENGESIATQAGNDFINAGGGNDTIASGVGDDIVFGGAGNDFITVSGGSDELHGGEGFDTLILSNVLSGSSSLLVDFAQGILVGDGINSTISGFEDIRDGRGDDIIIGSDSDERLRGDAGNNTLTGGGGADEFFFIPRNASSGDNTITDFNAEEGDSLIFFGGGYSFNRTEVGSDLVIEVFDDVNGGQLAGTFTLLDITLAEFGIM